MDNFFTFDGKSCLDFGIVATGAGTYNRPKRRVEHIDVPGRNGTLTVSDGTYENVTLWYDCYAFKNFPEKVDALSAWLLSKQGYVRLEDTYHPGHFRLAEFTGPIEPTPTTLMRSGTFRLEFNCRPEKYLKMGENFIKYELSRDGLMVYNPTLFETEPLIRFTTINQLTYPRLDAYVLTVNDTVMRIGRNSMGGKVDYDHINIDCESWEAYSDDGESRNNIVTLENKRFPKLKAGMNTISMVDDTEGIYAACDFYIMPRWWTV